MDTGITIFCWKGSKNRVARTSQSRPSFSLNHSNHCAVGTYWFLKGHFLGWFLVIFLFFLFSVVAFFITFFFDSIQQNNSNHAAVEPSVFGEKNVPPFKNFDFSIFHLRVCCFSLNLTRISCWWNIAPESSVFGDRTVMDKGGFSLVADPKSKMSEKRGPNGHIEIKVSSRKPQQYKNNTVLKNVKH